MLLLFVSARRTMSTGLLPPQGLPEKPPPGNPPPGKPPPGGPRKPPKELPRSPPQPPDPRSPPQPPGPRLEPPRSPPQPPPHEPGCANASLMTSNTAVAAMAVVNQRCVASIKRFPKTRHGAQHHSRPYLTPTCRRSCEERGALRN